MLLALSVANAAKTFMLPLISPVAMALTKSYTSAAALTGAPLMVSAGSALVAPMLARGWGRRPVMLGALGCMFFGSTWNAGGSAVRVGFPQLMAGRVFQGLGWGALDAMVMAGIRDIYFDHELPQIAAATRLLGLVTTWLPPLVSGLVAQSSGTIFSRSFAALAALSGLAWLLVGLALPETMFDRSGSGMLPTPSSLYRPSQPLKPRRSFPFVSREDMLSYAREMRVVRYDGYHDLHTLIQPLRAAAAPTTLLLFLAGLLPGTALWGLAASLSLLFAPLPFMLSAADVGLMLAGVFGLPLLVTAVLSMPNPWWDVVGWAPVRRQQRPWAGAFRRFARRIAGGRAPGNDGFDRRINVLLIAVGSSLALAGCIGFGAHAADCMLSGQDASVVAEEEPVPADEVPANLTAVAAMFAVDGEAVRHLSLPLLSVLLGLLATGVAVLDATSAPLIQRSAAFTSSTLAVGQRSIADMGAGLAAWKALVAGVAVVAVPNGVWWWEGLRTTVIGLGVGQVFVAVGVGVMWWAYEERTRRLDGRVMGLVDLEELKRTGSFFDPD